MFGDARSAMIGFIIQVVRHVMVSGGVRVLKLGVHIIKSRIPLKSCKTIKEVNTSYLTTKLSNMQTVQDTMQTISCFKCCNFPKVLPVFPQLYHMKLYKVLDGPF